jgi:hypothetical protein
MYNPLKIEGIEENIKTEIIRGILDKSLKIL